MRISQSFRMWRVVVAGARALPAAWPWYAARLRLLPVDLWQLMRRETLARRLMEQTQTAAAQNTQAAEAPATQDGHEPEKRPPRVQRILLVRHGQTTFNVEGRLPGQLPGVELTDEGRRQAHRAAVALSGLRISAIVSSPLERALETARIIARGWALEVREDPRLKDTDVGSWAGQKISDVAKNDPNWTAFLRKPTEPPPGVESLAAVQERAVAVIEDLRSDPTAGDDVVVVAHADIIKLIVARYTGVSVEGALSIVIANASISALAFTADRSPALLAANWTMAPDWLVTPTAPAAKPAQAPGGVSVPTNGGAANGAQSDAGDHPTPAPHQEEA
jgi:broad specificity phosphatase PhoE